MSLRKIELHITVVVGVAFNGSSAGKGVLAISQPLQLSAFGPLQALSITIIGRYTSSPGSSSPAEASQSIMRANNTFAVSWNILIGIRFDAAW